MRHSALCDRVCCSRPLSHPAPFTSGWWGTSLENVGLKDQRPEVGTYGCYNYANLPPLPITLVGDLAWLENAHIHEAHIGVEHAAEIAEAIPELLDSCNKARAALPGSFLKFVQTPSLQTRVRSNTDCFIDVPHAPVSSPAGEGVLVRFLADSQGCVFWYLYIPTGISDHAIVSSPHYYGPDEDQSYGPDLNLMVERDPRTLVLDRRLRRVGVRGEGSGATGTLWVLGS